MLPDKNINHLKETEHKDRLSKNRGKSSMYPLRKEEL